MAELQQQIEDFFDQGDKADAMAARAAFVRLRDALSEGSIRAAEPDADAPTGWRVNAWVKKGILLGFRFGRLADVSMDHGKWPFFDKDTMPIKTLGIDQQVRLVPGGSAVREGAFVGRGVICMPPMYINIGAYIGECTLIDSHALVGSCAQVGARVHVSAGVQIGGVLEPPNARPVIVEDEAFLGGQCGLYEGVLVRARAVIAAGVVLTGSTRVFDLVHARELARRPGEPLEIPANAVVVPGTRPAAGDFAREHGLGLACALIVKYRDERTDRATALEDALR
jgi:2,3,4,5-tetrahydropyridine-2-carboxylate N-succinyltransferase